MTTFKELFPKATPIIGMIHLPALPDYDASPGIDAVIESALRDLSIYEKYGVDGLLIENEYDRPHRVEASDETIEAMIAVTDAVITARETCVVGVEILLNDPIASLDVAKATGADFIRTDYFVDRMSRPEYGEFKIDPEGLINYRKSINGEDILIMADIQVKHAEMLDDRTLEQSAALATKYQAEALVVSGTATGRAPDLAEIDAAMEGAGVPVIIGSGLDHHNAVELLNHCNGAIVGTALMTDKVVDDEKVQKLMSLLGKT